MRNKVLIAGLIAVLSGFVWLNVYSLNHIQEVAGRGCCSGHKGVCGCQNGHAKCCDGSFSPSCKCFKDDVKGFCI